MCNEKSTATAHEFGLFLIEFENDNDLGRGTRRRVYATKQKFDNWGEQKSVDRYIKK